MVCRAAAAIERLIELWPARFVLALANHAIMSVWPMALAPLVRRLPRVKRAPKPVYHLPGRILAAWWRHDPNVKMRAVGSHPGLRLVNAERRPGLRLVNAVLSRRLGRGSPAVVGSVACASLWRAVSC